MRPSAPLLRSLDLNLRRIARMRLFENGQGFQAVHVAGTNGKGSICYALSCMLNHTGMRWGRFTSPYLTHPSDAVVVNGVPMSPDVWQDRANTLAAEFAEHTNRKIQKQMRMQAELDELRAILGLDGDGAGLETTAPTAEQKTRLDLLTKGLARFGGPPDPHETLSEFEMQTAIAVREFNTNPDVNIGIVEVGMGGTADATNIIPQKAVTVISRIDLDHMEYLGSNLTRIANKKAGIMVDGAPCVIDGRNDAEVVDVLVACARRVNAPYFITTNWNAFPLNIAKNLTLIENLGRKLGLPRYTIDNLWCAFLAWRLTLERMGVMDFEAYLNHEDLATVVYDIVTSALPPGRLQCLQLPARFGQKGQILVDGAHNYLGASTLGEYIWDHRKRSNKPVTWIFALSQSQHKSPAQFMYHLPLLPNDRFAAIQYHVTGAADPLPVRPSRLLDGIRANVRGLTPGSVWDGQPYISEDLLQWAVDGADGGLIVITGSLYMLRELFRLVLAPGAMPSPLMANAALERHP